MYLGSKIIVVLPTCSIYAAGKATVFKKLVLDKDLQEATLVTTASNISHKQTESDRSKAFLLFARTTSTSFSISYAKNDLLKK